MSGTSSSYELMLMTSAGAPVFERAVESVLAELERFEADFDDRNVDRGVGEGVHFNTGVDGEATRCCYV